MGSSCGKQPVIRRSSARISEFSKIISLKNKFQYVNSLGHGSYGRVRLFRNNVYKDMHCAIKTLPKEYISSTLYNCLIDEVNILRGLDHPNIVKYYETIEDESYIHIVMEYLEGENVFTRYNTEPIEEASLCKIFKQLLKALLFLHNKSLIHRDIKPENILFTKQGDYSTLKLIDFGLSTNSKANDRKIVGSPFYMSPETISGKIEPKSDLWSVGVILFLLLTGEYPFSKNGNTKELFSQIKYKPYNREKLDGLNCSKEVNDLVTKLLIKNSNKRLSAQEALQHPWFRKYANDTQIVRDYFTKETIDILNQFHGKQSIQKEILFFIARISKDDEIKQLTEMFNCINKSNSGVLNKGEVNQAFMVNDINLSNRDMNIIWDSLNFHNNTGVNYTEFITAMISELAVHKEDKLFSAFKYFENQEDEGFVTFDSIIQSVKAFNININENSIRQGFKEDKLDYEGFKLLLCSNQSLAGQ